MSHEIRTPMNGHPRHAGCSADTPQPDNGDPRPCWRMGETLLTLIDDILDLSKIEAGKLTLEKRGVSTCTQP